jgi:hypothetical protein
MSEETKHGTPTRPGENQGGRQAPMQCAEFEALLTDAIEGKLSTADKERFETHRRACAVCGPLFADVEAGRLWLQSLETVEPPVHLVHNILVATTGVVSTRLAPAAPGASTTPLGERVREWWDSWFAPARAFVEQPRFVMSFGMIFFTFSLLVSAAGVKASDVARIDLRPSALRHAYNGAQIKFVQYYDNIRFVYEIESRARELKRTTIPAEPAPTQKKENRNNDNTSGQPDLKQDRNYSCQDSQTVLAGLIGPSEAVTLRQAASPEPGAPKQSGFGRVGWEPAAPSKLLFARSSQLVTRGSATLATDRRYL